MVAQPFQEVHLGSMTMELANELVSLILGLLEVKIKSVTNAEGEVTDCDVWIFNKSEEKTILLSSMVLKIDYTKDGDASVDGTTDCEDIGGSFTCPFPA